MDNQNPQGLGDVVAFAFASVGITVDRAQRVANAIGVRDCGCGRRREALNRLFPFGGPAAGSSSPATTDQSGGGDSG